MPDCPLANAEDLRGALAIVKARAKTCEHVSLLALCEEWAPAEWERVALEEGFAMALNMMGMAADHLLPPRRASPELVFRRVSDETTARDLAMINAQAYGIALVATVPEAHGKGYAEAVMRHTVQQAERAMGPVRITLHASDMERPVYQAMGFEPGARVMLLTPADASAGH